ncbi:MAG: hypothetical protein U0470_04965 [Anaerolineae bacterium]
MPAAEPFRAGFAGLSRPQCRGRGASRGHRSRPPVALLLPALLALLALLAASPAATAQTKRAHYQTYAVDVTIQKNGDLRVVEDLTVSFDEGTFTTGYVDLSTRGADAIVEARRCAGAAVPRRRRRAEHVQGHGPRRGPHAGAVVVRARRVPADEPLRRRLYRARRAAAVMSKATSWWTVIRPDRPLVDSAVITVTLPDDVPGWTQGSGYIQPREGANWKPVPADRVSDHIVRVRVDAVESSASVEVRCQWPHGYIQATPSAFQAELDASRAGEQAQIDAATSSDGSGGASAPRTPRAGSRS